MDDAILTPESTITRTDPEGETKTTASFPLSPGKSLSGGPMPTPNPPALTYTVRPTPAPDGRLRITVKRGRQRAQALEAFVPTGPTDSPFAPIATTILTHYFQVHEHESPDRAATLAAKHRTAISRLISARLARNPSGVATLSDSEIASHLLTHIISPPVDHWIARYSVESSNGDKLYTVAKKDDGTWGCTCPVFKFRHIECKHIQAVQANPSWFPFQPTH